MGGRGAEQGRARWWRNEKRYEGVQLRAEKEAHQEDRRSERRARRTRLDLLDRPKSKMKSD